MNQDRDAGTVRVDQDFLYGLEFAVVGQVLDHVCQATGWQVVAALAATARIVSLLYFAAAITKRVGRHVNGAGGT